MTYPRDCWTTLSGAPCLEYEDVILVLRDGFADCGGHGILRLDGCPNPRAACELFALMTSLSEECYCAGWLNVDLLDLAKAGGGAHGIGEVTFDDACELLRLREACGGWIRRPHDADAPVWTPTEGPHG